MPSLFGLSHCFRLLSVAVDNFLCKCCEIIAGETIFDVVLEEDSIHAPF
jgi:hypothetical protein